MRRLLIGKILGFTAAVLLVVNLFFPNFITYYHKFSQQKTEENKFHSYKSIDDSLIQFVNEGAEENFEEDVEDEGFHFISNFDFFDFISFENKKTSTLKIQLKKYNLVEITKQSVPRWLLVRHILI
ncbi:MAG: hypothetical protein ACK5B9_08580 [Flavobacteriia bacterium]|jgi:hypothetical protein